MEQTADGVASKRPRKASLLVDWPRPAAETQIHANCEGRVSMCQANWRKMTCRSRRPLAFPVPSFVLSVFIVAATKMEAMLDLVARCNFPDKSRTCPSEGKSTRAIDAGDKGLEVSFFWTLAGEMFIGLAGMSDAQSTLAMRGVGCAQLKPLEMPTCLRIVPLTVPTI